MCERGEVYLKWAAALAQKLAPKSGAVAGQRTVRSRTVHTLQTRSALSALVQKTAQKHTSMTMRPEGSPAMVVSKKTCTRHLKRRACNPVTLDQSSLVHAAHVAFRLIIERNQRERHLWVGHDDSRCTVRAGASVQTVGRSGSRRPRVTFVSVLRHSLAGRGPGCTSSTSESFAKPRLRRATNPRRQPLLCSCQRLRNHKTMLDADTLSARSDQWDRL